MTNSMDGKQEGLRSQHDRGIQNAQYIETPPKLWGTTMSARPMAQAPSPKTPMYSSWDTRISIAVDPVALITTECITVTSAMRKHARWAHSSVSAILGGGPSMARDISRLQKHGERSLTAGQRQSGKITNGTVQEDDTLASRWGLRGKKGKSMQDNPLLSAFARLRNDLRGCIGMNPWGSNIQIIDTPQTSEASTSLRYSIPFSKSFAPPQPPLRSPLLQSLR